jgi:transcriptional regulator with XRE-family HTH domain
MNSTDPRQTPMHLPSKLRRIRTELGLSQQQLLSLLKLTKYYHYTRISIWERGHREPPGTVVMGYARLVGLPMEVFYDDALKLPEKLSLAIPPPPPQKKKAASKKSSRGRQ